MQHAKTKLKDEDRTRCEVSVSEDRLSSGRTQPSERPAGVSRSETAANGRTGSPNRAFVQSRDSEARKPGRIVTSGTGHDIELADHERTRCEVWTRVMGYHRPVSAWNPGKQSEHAERKYFIELNPGSTDEDRGSTCEDNKAL